MKVYTCIICQREFEAGRGLHKVCSDECRLINLQRQRQKYYEKHRIEICKRVNEHRQINWNEIKHKILERNRQSYYRNQAVQLQRGKDRYLQNKHVVLERSKQYYVKNKDRISKRGQAYFQANKSKIQERMCRYLKTNIQAKLSSALRRRMYMALHGKGYQCWAVEHLGCTVIELKQYLETKFQPGMTWENWSFGGWHIDHIQPLASFDLTDVEQVKRACHYTNLQPLWAVENFQKNKRIKHAN